MTKPAETIDLRQISQQKRERNRNSSAHILAEHGIDFDTKNDGAHLIVKHNGLTVDFWPGTGKFIPRKPKPKHGRGVFNLIKMLEEHEHAAD